VELTSLPSHAPASERLVFLLRPWARQMAARFGYPVLLVGSSLTVPDPRDVDVRVTLPDEDFASRYGMDWPTWTTMLWYNIGEAGPMRTYANDMATLSREAARVLRLNIDFAVHPASLVQALWPDRRVVRLDDLDGLPDAMSFLR
jgi:hypothetical protein